MSIFNKVFVKKEISSAKIRKCAPILLRGIGFARYIFKNYIMFNSYLEATDKNSSSIVLYIQREIYIVNNLKTKFLIKINILEPKKIS